MKDVNMEMRGGKMEIRGDNMETGDGMWHGKERWQYYRRQKIVRQYDIELAL